jgi:hypothetical protein
MAAKVTVRELVTKLTIGGDAGDKLAKFGLKMEGIKAGLGILVGTFKLATAATLGLVDAVTAQNDVIAKTSRTLAITAKEYQRLTFSADRSGIAMKTMERAVLMLNKGMAESGTSSGKKFDDSLSRLHLTMKELAGLNTEERIGRIGEALQRVTDETQRTNIAQRIFGERAGPRLANLLMEGEGGIKRLGDEAERLGLVLDGEALAASEAFQDSMTNMRAVLTGVKNSIGVSLIPIVERAVKKFTQWLLLNRKFITSKFEKGVKFLTKAFSGLVKDLDKVVNSFGDLADLSVTIIRMFIEMADAVGGVKNAVKLLTVAWGTYRVAALAATVGLSLTPLGLLSIALLGIAAAFTSIETKADRARHARKRFDSLGGVDEEDESDPKAVARDAAALVKLVQSGRGISGRLRGRLVTGSRLQIADTLDRAGGLIRQSSRQKAAARLPIAGKSGVRAVISKSKRAKIARIGAGELSLLKEIEAEINFARRDINESREEDPNVALISGLSRPDVDSGGLSGKLGASGKPEKESLSDLLANAIKSGQLPESAALLASTQPPIIIGPIINNSVTVEVDAPLNFEGIQGENATEFVDRVGEVFEDLFGRKMLEAIDELRPQLAR